MRSATIDHAASQAEMQPWIEMECLQLSPGKRLGRLDSIDLGCRQVVRETQEAAVQKLGATPVNLCTLSFCTLDPAFRFSEHDAGNADTIFFMPENTEFDLYVPAGAQTTYISLDQGEFLNAARVLNPAEWDNAPRGVKMLQSVHKTQFRDALETWFNVAAESNASLDENVMRGLLFQAALLMATSTRENAGAPPPAARVRALQVCRQARAFAEHRLESDELPSIVDLCTATGVSERTLQYAFRTHVGMSPMAYLRRLRLNRVRAALMAASPSETTVTAAAMHHGFLHLGRFAQDYKRVFDETPSLTLAS